MENDLNYSWKYKKMFTNKNFIAHNTCYVQ